MPNVAVVGCGYWGKNLIRVFNELGALKTVCDTSKNALNALEHIPHVKKTDSFDKVLQDPGIDAIVIAAPAVMHYQLAKQALHAGKHVFVEKPLALTVKDGEEIRQIVKETGKILLIGHILNYHPAIIALKEIIDRGELGRIEYIYSNRLNIGKLRKEENILWSFAPHDVSVILMLLNESPKKIQSFGGSYLQQNIYDTTVTALDFDNGVKAHIFVSWLHPFKEQKLVVIGNKKMAVFDDVAEQKLSLYPHKIEWKNRIPVAQKAEKEVIQIEKAEPLKAECQHFLNCISENVIPHTDVNEGLRVLRVLTASEQSLRENGSTVIINDTIENKKYMVHPSSFVDNDATIEENTQIWHFSHILKGSHVGKNCKIGQNVVIGPHVTIGDSCKIQNNVSIYEGIVLEDAVFCGPSCVFTNVFNPRSEVPRMSEIRHTLVKKGATIGANATIVCGNTLGKYSFIGAGAVVTKSIPDYALVYGNPAAIKGWVCECGVKLEFKKSKAVCKSCTKKYKIKNKIAELTD